MGAERPRAYEFVLVLTGPSEPTTEMEDALFEAGCDDATLSFRGGRPYLAFTRTAPSFLDAVLSAIRDVRKADVGADVLRVDVGDDAGGLVTQSDIARAIHRSRQLVHQYVKGSRGPGGFPPPACRPEDGGPLWLWHEVARWLWENDMLPEEALREAEGVEIINNALGARHLRRISPKLARKVLRTVGQE
jgi:hypothetical protein